MKIIECPRDAMQGWPNFIPTQQKITYLNQLLKVGYDTLDFGSFVSPKVIPQMRDTEEVIQSLELTDTKLLAIIANLRGLERAQKFDTISYLGYPFSISETFQLRNTNQTLERAFENVKKIQQLTQATSQELVIYLSMGFGNPYGDDWDTQLVYDWCKKMIDIGITKIMLSDTVGVGTRQHIAEILNYLIPKYPEAEIGVHLHVTRKNSFRKIEPAINHHCKRIDVAIHGIGGCPLAKDDLIGNLATQDLLEYLLKNDKKHTLNSKEFEKSVKIANQTFI